MTDTKTKLDERFKFGPPPIQTPEDAREAFLRGEISEDQLREALGRFGTLSDQLATQVAIAPERPDAAFENKLPDDLVTAEATPYNDLEYRQKLVADKQKERDAATEAAEKSLKDSQKPIPVSTPTK